MIYSIVALFVLLAFSLGACLTQKNYEIIHDRNCKCDCGEKESSWSYPEAIQ
jgi:hypothetical protein